MNLVFHISHLISGWLWLIYEIKFAQNEERFRLCVYSSCRATKVLNLADVAEQAVLAVLCPSAKLKEPPSSVVNVLVLHCGIAIKSRPRILLPVLPSTKTFVRSLLSLWNLLPFFEKNILQANFSCNELNNKTFKY